VVAWRRALRLARIEGFRFHDLRHTFASHFAMRRGDLYALAKIVGHSNPKITFDRYAHLSPEFVHAQHGIMDQMYTGGRADRQQMDTVRKNQTVSDSQVIERSGSPNCTICEPSDLRFHESLTGKMHPPSNLICSPAEIGK